MLMTIWDIAQMLWNDPVWSKVIAAGVLALLAALGSYLVGLWPLIGAWLVSASSSPRWLLLLFATAVSFLVFSVTWRMTHDNYVIPLEEQVAHLEEQVTRQSRYIQEMNATCEPNSTLVEQLRASNKTLESNMTQWVDTYQQFPDIVEGWKKGHAELQKTLNSYVANCSILSEVRELDSRKVKTENYLMKSGYSTESYEVLRRQAADFQDRIRDLNQKLACEPR